MCLGHRPFRCPVKTAENQITVYSESDRTYRLELAGGSMTDREDEAKERELGSDINSEIELELKHLQMRNG